MSDQPKWILVKKDGLWSVCRQAMYGTTALAFYEPVATFIHGEDAQGYLDYLKEQESATG